MLHKKDKEMVWTAKTKEVKAPLFDYKITWRIGNIFKDENSWWSMSCWVKQIPAERSWQVSKNKQGKENCPHEAKTDLNLTFVDMCFKHKEVILVSLMATSDWKKYTCEMRCQIYVQLSCIYICDVECHGQNTFFKDFLSNSHWKLCIGFKLNNWASIACDGNVLCDQYFPHQWKFFDCFFNKFANIYSNWFAQSCRKDYRNIWACVFFVTKHHKI